MRIPMDDAGLQKMLDRLVRADPPALAFADALGLDWETKAEVIADVDILECLLRDVDAEDVHEAMVRVIPQAARMRIHPFAARVLGQLGVSPVVMAAFSSWAERSSYHDEPDGTSVGLHWNERTNTSTVSVHFDPHGMIWDHDDMDYGLLSLDRALPDTMLATLTGRPLRDVVSHPLLDSIQVHVVSATPANDGGLTVLRLSLPEGR